MESQPALPTQQIPRTLQYAPAGEEAPPWMIATWPALCELFDLRDHEVVAWHQALAGQGRPWLVIRRVHQVAPLWGDGASPDDMKAWSWAELSSALGVSEKLLRADLEAARDFWRKARVAGNFKRNIEGLSPAPEDAAEVNPFADVNPLDGLADFQIHQGFTEEQIAAILTPMRFNDSVRSPSDRLYVANRILELKSLLLDKHRREPARTLIVMEINISSHEMTMGMMKSRLDTLRKGAELTKDQSTEVAKLAESIASTEKVLTALQKTYREAADDLAGDEMESGEMRRVAIGTISHLTMAHQQYYADGSRTIIDGMFTADEVMWLTQPLSIRPAQYRIDIVLRVREAMIPENLWAKDYQPSVIQRDACRRMLRIAQLLADEQEAPVIQGIDDAVAQEGDGDDPAEVAEAISNVDAAASAAGLEMPMPEPSFPREEEPFMAVG